MAIPHRRIRGKIHYTSDHPDHKGRERGREHFTMTFQGNGRKTLRAYIESDDDPNVMRDVTLSLRPDWRPENCFVQISLADKFVGSSWFLFTDSEAICEGFTVQEGRVSQRYPLVQAIDGFGTHPLSADAWLTCLVDHSKGTGRKTYPNVMMCSLDHRGTTGPLLMRHPIGLQMSFVGRERIKVAAGTFDSLHFTYTEVADENAESRNEVGFHPPYDIWCTADGDRVFLRAEVRGYIGNSYELTEYERFDAKA